VFGRVSFPIGLMYESGRVRDEKQKSRITFSSFAHMSEAYVPPTYMHRFLAWWWRRRRWSGLFCDCHVKEEMDFAGTIRKKLRGWAAPSFSFFLRPAAFKGSGYIRILRLSLLLSQAGVCSFEVGSEEEGKEKKQSKKPIYLFSMPASH